MKPKKRKKTLVLLVIFTVFVMVKLSAQTVPDGIIYLLGIDKSSAYYMKDSTRFNLSGEKAFASDITVESGHVYVAGSYEVNGIERACYWKDGVLQPLSGVPENNRAIGIAVSQERVYIRGTGISNLATGRTSWYWFDGRKTDIPISQHGSMAAQGIIDVYNGIPYIAGTVYHNTDTMAAFGESSGCYWTNGRRIDLPNSRSALYTTVSGGRVYIAGYDNNGKPCYWIDDRQYPLPYSSDGSGIMSLAVAEGKVYILGYDYYEGPRYYWIDGRKGPNIPGNNPTATAIAVFRDKIFVAGNETRNGTRTACYWIDGRQYFVPGEDGWLRGIVVAER